MTSIIGRFHENKHVDSWKHTDPILRAKTLGRKLNLIFGKVLHERRPSEAKLSQVCSKTHLEQLRHHFLPGCHNGYLMRHLQKYILLGEHLRFRDNEMINFVGHIQLFWVCLDQKFENWVLTGFSFKRLYLERDQSTTVLSFYGTYSCANTWA